MMKKRASIEDEFMHYNADDLLGEKRVEKEQRDILSTIIRLLTILVLLGVLVLGGFLGYKYLIKEDAPKALPVTSKETTMTQTIKKPQERMYTEKEMYEIVQKMMNQMQAEAKKTEVVEKKHIAAQGNKDAEEEFVSALQNFEEEFVQSKKKELPTVSKERINSEIVGVAKDAPKGNQNQVVVVKQSQYRENVDKISNQINALVEEMQGKIPPQTSTYTQEITKEVDIRKNAMRIIVVRPGDTLSKIAKRAYGSAMAYDRIFDANPNLINDPNRIYIGQRLRVPLD